MDKPSDSIRELAKRLLDIEAARSDSPEEQSHTATRVVETLRVSLIRFAGPDGFHALMRRALVLARAEAPELSSVTVNPNGSIEGMDSIGADGGEPAAAAVTAHLLWLLVTFIGEPMTMRLVREAWRELQ